MSEGVQISVARTDLIGFCDRLDAIANPSARYDRVTEVYLKAVIDTQRELAKGLIKDIDRLTGAA